VQTAQALFDQAPGYAGAWGWLLESTCYERRYELEAEQQRLVVAQNDYEKSRCSPGTRDWTSPGQIFVLADKIPVPPRWEINLSRALERAL